MGRRKAIAVVKFDIRSNDDSLTVLSIASGSHKHGMSDDM